MFDFKEIAISLVGFILVVLLNSVFKAYKDYLSNNNRRNEENHKGWVRKIALEMFREVKGILDEIIRTAVLAAEETKAKDIREKVKKGELPKEYLCSIAGEVLLNVKSQLNNTSRKILQDNIGDLDAYIKSKIEENLVYIKPKNTIKSFIDLKELQPNGIVEVVALEEKIIKSEKKYEEELTGELLREKEEEDNDSH